MDLDTLAREAGLLSDADQRLLLQRLAGALANTGERAVAEAPGDEIGRFADQAEAYCAFVQGAHRFGVEDRLRHARVRLLDLYRAALDLPHVDAAADEEAPTGERAPDWPGFGAWELYRETFDPYRMDDPGCGELTDDVLDVFRDVAAGLSFWRAGRWREAAAAWRSSFDSHWGRHAVSGLRVLHHALGGEADGRPGA